MTNLMVLWYRKDGEFANYCEDTKEENFTPINEE